MRGSPEVPRGAGEVAELGVVGEVQLLEGHAGADLVGQPLEVVGREGHALDGCDKRRSGEMRGAVKIGHAHCRLPISGGNSVILFLYSCSSRSLVRLVKISGGRYSMLLEPVVQRRRSGERDSETQQALT